jgi:glycosyltransferase involved in cell wall biosynthesis
MLTDRAQTTGPAAALAEDAAGPPAARPERRGTPRGRVVLVMPAYNAADTLRQTWADIPAGYVDEHVLVDDASRDDTVAIARALGIRVLEHARNRGYGGNQKTCYRDALDRGADIVIMLHPDYQYDPRLVPMMILPLRLGILDVMLGSRVRTRRECLESGMPLYKYLGNRLLTFVENVALGQNMGEFHSGFRAYRREVLETVPFERFSDDFVFDSQFLVSAVDAGFRLGEIPVPVRYMPEASSIGFRRSVRYGFGTLAAVGQYLLKRAGFPPAPIFAAPRARAAGMRSRA